MNELPVWKDSPIMTDSMTWIDYHPSVEKAFILEDKFGEELNLSTVFETNNGNKYLGIPRHCCPKVGKDLRVEGDEIEVNCTVLPRNTEQTRAIAEIDMLMAEGRSHIFRATTGFGKTYVACSVLASVKRPTLIVVTKEDLVEQWTAAILGMTDKPGYLDLTPEDIGIAQGDKCQWVGKKIVIGMVHSLAKDKYGDAFKRHFGLVIFDEVHRMGAETFSEVCKQFPAKLRLGLSATPTRTDGRDFVFHAHIGPVLVHSDLQQMALKVLVKRTQFQLPILTQYIKRPGGWEEYYGPLLHKEDRMMGVYKAMAADPVRNRMLLEAVVAAFRKDRRTIVFSHLKDHLTVLRAAVVATGAISDEDMAFYVGGMSKEKREIAKTKRVIWATYAMTKEATDIPALDTAVLATPIAHPKQAVGRVLREVEGKKNPVVYDPVDTCSDILERFFSSRCKEYRSLNAELVELQ